MSEKMRLFEQFPPVSTGEWMEKIRVDLKGADFYKTMVWRPVEGLEVMPFYREEDLESLQYTETMPGEFPYLRGTGKTLNSWYIRQDIDAGDAREANNKALSLLSRGIDSICFAFPSGNIFSKKGIEALLDGIFLEAIEINFSPRGNALELLKAFREVVAEKGIKPSIIRGVIETDPIGRLIEKGKLCLPMTEGLDYLAELVSEARVITGLKVLRVNGSFFGNAGATAVEELAFTLAMGNEYMHQLTSRGITPDEAALSMGFTFGIGSGYFMEIAKLRAARMLWATVVKKYLPSGTDPMKMNIHSVTTDWNKTVYDPYVNMLRTQTEAMSAIIGGVDSLTVNPFDSIFTTPGEFSERIARNQQLLLKEEAHLDKVVDPSAGSYYIEKLTASLAEKAWTLFLEVEEQGGFLESLEKGYVQDMIERTSIKRKKDVAKGREKLLGTNIYPNINESLPGFNPEQTPVNKVPGEQVVRPVSATRAAEDFEKLRNSTDRSGKRPKVFMLNIGNIARRKARSQFSSNFFAVAGYEIIDNNGFATAREGVDEALKREADVIVLCSSDEEYEQYGPETYSLLKERAILVIAGDPACADMLRAKGIKYFINIKSNLLDTLQEFNRLMQIGV